MSGYAHRLVNVNQIRIFLHILAAAVWVGGQFTLAGLVSTVRGLGEGAMKPVARAFARIAWPAYIVLFGTGMWNLAEIEFNDVSTNYKIWFGIKMAAWLVSGFGAALHALVPKTWARAAGGTAASLGAVVALLAAAGMRYPTV